MTSPKEGTGSCLSVMFGGDGAILCTKSSVFVGLCRYRMSDTRIGDTVRQKGLHLERYQAKSY